MYLIPKNIKTKSEIFSGFGIIEIIIIGLSLGIGYLFQLLSSNFYLKVFDKHIFVCYYQCYKEVQDEKRIKISKN